MPLLLDLLARQTQVVNFISFRHALFVLALASLTSCELFAVPTPTNESPQIDDETADADGVPANSYCAGVKTWSADAARFEEDILTLVNEKRAEGADCHSQGKFAPVAPLQMNANLRCAARVHSLDMATRDFFDHVNPEGQDPGYRIAASGFSGSTWGENIAAGSADAAGTIKQWMDSDGHCANIMRPEFSRLGVGYAQGGSYRYVWTQAFGG